MKTKKIIPLLFASFLLGHVAVAEESPPLAHTLDTLRQRLEGIEEGDVNQKTDSLARDYKAFIKTTFLPENEMEYKKFMDKAWQLAGALLSIKGMRPVDLSVTDDPRLAAVDALLQRLESEIDPDWDFPRGSANISPPPGAFNSAGLRYAGMPPERIVDPVLRQQYLDAIAKNAADQIINYKQDSLIQTRTSILRACVGWHIRYGDRPATKAEILARFGTNEERRKDLEREFKSYNMK